MLSLSCNVLYIWEKQSSLHVSHSFQSNFKPYRYTFERKRVPYRFLIRFRVISNLTWNFASLTLWRLQLVIVAYWDGGLAGWTNVWESWGLEVGISWISYSLECPSFKPCLYNSIVDGLTTNIDPLFFFQFSTLKSNFTFLPFIFSEVLSKKLATHYDHLKKNYDIGNSCGQT